MQDFENHIGGVIARVLVSSAIDFGFESRSGHTKDYTIGISRFSAKHTTIRRKIKYWLARIRMMNPCGATCISAVCCFNELALYKSN